MIKRLLLLSAVSLLCFTAPVSSLDPDALSDEDKQLISAKCSEVQRNMQRLQRTDTVSRINRGSTYSILIRLMSSMSSRAAINTFNVPALTSSTNAVQEMRGQFAEAYTTYEIALQNLIDMPCDNKPDEFYRALVDVRQKRAIINTHIREIDIQLQAFSSGLGELKTQMEAR